MNIPRKFINSAACILLLLFILPAICMSLTISLNRPYISALDFAEPPISSPFPIMAFSSQSEDFLFHSTPELIFQVKCSRNVVFANWQLCRNLVNLPLTDGKGEMLPGNSFRIRIPTKCLAPGFFDLHIKLDMGNAEQTNLIGFGYRVNDIDIPTDRPPDFKAFWSVLVELVKVLPLNAQEGPWQSFDEPAIENYNLSNAFLPKRDDPDGVRFSQVEAQTVIFSGWNGSRITAQIARPVGSNVTKLPAILSLPGAGDWNAIRPFPLDAARHGYLAMEVSIHGVGGISSNDSDPRRNSPDYAMVANALQALKYIRTRPDVDPTKTGVAGMSQGGRLSIVLASLAPHDLRVALPNIAHYSYLRYQTWAKETTGNGQQRGPRGGAPWSEVDYQDVLNFAPEVNCPVLISAGLLDPISPPTCVYAVFKTLGSTDKVFIPMPELGHFGSCEVDRRAWRFLEKYVPPAVWHNPS